MTYSTLHLCQLLYERNQSGDRDEAINIVLAAAFAENASPDIRELASVNAVHSLLKQKRSGQAREVIERAKPSLSPVLDAILRSRADIADDNRESAHTWADTAIAGVTDALNGRNYAILRLYCQILVGLWTRFRCGNASFVPTCSMQMPTVCSNVPIASVATT